MLVVDHASFEVVVAAADVQRAGQGVIRIAHRRRRRQLPRPSPMAPLNLEDLEVAQRRHELGIVGAHPLEATAAQALVRGHAG